MTQFDTDNLNAPHTLRELGVDAAPVIDTSREAVMRLMDGVTPGPWMYDEHAGSVFGVANYVYYAEDARFIAASRDLVPALLARAEAADAEIARLTAERDAALAGAVKVKPLVWEDDGHGNLRAQSIRGGEGIDAMRYADGELAHFEAWGIDAYFHDHNSAMAAVQHEIEAEVSAILAALEPQPITVQDAARVLAGRAQDCISALEALPNRKEILGGQRFTYVQLGEAVTALRAIAEGKS